MTMAGKISLSIEVGLGCDIIKRSALPSTSEEAGRCCETHLDAVQDGGVEDVDSGVDAVADKVLGLLDKAVDGG